MKAKLTPKQRFEYLMGKSSVEFTIIPIIKPFTSWKNGISFIKLKEEVEKIKKKNYCAGRIYQAISLINRFGKDYGVYLRNEIGEIEVDGKIKMEYRYFVPKEQEDISREKGDLEYRKEIVNLRENHLEHHEKVTIPQEEKLAEIQR